jgi:hypothetical protein
MEQRLGAQVDRIRTALDSDCPAIERTAALAVLRDVATGWLRTDLPDEPPMPWDRQCLHWPLAFPEVLLGDSRSGFDAVVGNPPFLTGTSISTVFGATYAAHIADHIAKRSTGRADLVTFFFTRATDLSENFGLLATNSISQGDSREVGLNRLVAAGWTIYRAVKSTPWPSEATLEIAKVWCTSRPWLTRRRLDDQSVEAISTLLEPERRVAGEPFRLHGLSTECFEGCYPLGQAFYVEPRVGEETVAMAPDEADVLAPYLNGEELNSSPRLQASKWAVNFGDRDQATAAAYENSWRLVADAARADRMALSDSGYPGLKDRWWQYWRPRSELYRRIADRGRVLVITQTSRTVQPAFVPMPTWFDKALRIFIYDDDGHFGLLSSSFHWWWAVTYGSTMRTDLRYTPSDVFETFPQPDPLSKRPWDAIASVGKRLDEFRADVMIRANLGLTKTYNRVHDPEDQDPDIARLRQLHRELDFAVRNAYDWSDLALDHHHWGTPQGMRFTVSPEAKDELLDRLLALNHERYAAEVEAGLHNKKPSKSRSKRTREAFGSQGSLL